MSLVRAIVVSPEEAADGNAEFWCGREQLAVTVLHEGRIHLRVDPRRDGEPWLIDADSCPFTKCSWNTLGAGSTAARKALWAGVRFIGIVPK